MMYHHKMDISKTSPNKVIEDQEQDGEKLGHKILYEGGKESLDTEQSTELPDWFDAEKFKRGQKYWSENYYCMTISNLCGLILVLAVPSIRRVLMHSKESSTPYTAYKRYLSTVLRILEWSHGDITDRKSSSFKNLMIVRSFHTSASKTAGRCGFGNITQKDMVLTQFAFIGLPLLSPQVLGLTSSKEGFEGLIHFWRVIGYLLGIQDEYNLCHENIEVTREACRVCMDEYYRPIVKEFAEDFMFMTTVMLDGMWAINPTLDTEGFFNYFKTVVGIPCSQLSNRYSQRMFDFQLYVSNILNTSWAIIVRPLLNYYLWLNINLIKRFPILAYIVFRDQM